MSRKNKIDWSSGADAYIKAHYPYESAVDIADHLGMSDTTVSQRAKKLGLKKDKSYDRANYRNRYVKGYVNGWYKNIKSA